MGLRFRGLTLAVTDLDRWGEATVAADDPDALFQVAQHGAVAIPAKLLENAVSLGAGTAATVRVTGTDKAPKASLAIAAQRCW